MAIPQLAIGEFIQVKRSNFLGTPACTAVVVGHIPQGYIVQEIFKGSEPNGEDFEVSYQGVMLMGPPTGGLLTEAP